MITSIHSYIYGALITAVMTLVRMVKVKIVCLIVLNCLQGLFCKTES